MKAMFGPDTELVRDIRTVGVALAKEERAIAGVDLVRSIKDYTAKSGTVRHHRPASQPGRTQTSWRSTTRQPEGAGSGDAADGRRYGRGGQAMAWVTR